jgi:hypothetical protein
MKWKYCQVADILKEAFPSYALSNHSKYYIKGEQQLLPNPQSNHQPSLGLGVPSFVLFG